MATDEEKYKISKLLKDLEVPEVKLTEKCNDIIKIIREKFETEPEEAIVTEIYDNPYVVDNGPLQEIEQKLKELTAEGKRCKKGTLGSGVNIAKTDPERLWRTNSQKEKLLRIENDLKRHIEKSNDPIKPMEDEHMRQLVEECVEETRVSGTVSANRLKESVCAAKRSLPNFQYRIDNSTATSILPDAHDV